MGFRRPSSSLVLTLLLAVCCVLSQGALAQARIVHVPAGSFGSEGPGPGQLTVPWGIAVNDVTHNVYVVDQGNNRVEEFSAAGTFITEFNGSASPSGAFSKPTNIAVDNSDNPLDPSAGDVYVVDSGKDRGFKAVIDKFTESGVYVGQITGTPRNEFNGGAGAEIAVDSTGKLWVLQDGNTEVDVFSDALENEYISGEEVHDKEFEGGTLGSYGGKGFAVDSKDDFYLEAGVPGAVGQNAVYSDSRFDSIGKFEFVNGFGSFEDSRAMIVDNANDELFVDYNEIDKQKTEIAAFSLGGEPLESFSGPTDLTYNKGIYGSFGIAVDESDGTVYETDEGGGRVLRYDAVTLPSVSLASLSDRSPKAVTLNGMVSPEGSAVTSCEFEYVAAGEYEPSLPDPYARGGKLACEPASLGTGSAPVPPVSVSAALAGLVPGAKYDYRLVAENSVHVPSSTGNQEFTAGPAFSSVSAGDVTSDSVRLQAQVDPEGAGTHYYFEYGTTSGYGVQVPLTAPGVDLGSGEVAQNVAVRLEGLTPGTTYHYDIVAEQDGESFMEPDRVFTTQGVGGGAVLSDGRQWELASPTNKKGASLEPIENADEIQAAVDGDGVTYLSAGPNVGEGAMGKITWDQVLSKRGLSGWTSESMTLPNRIPENGESAAELTIVHPEFALFSPDLSLALVEPQGFGTPPLAPGVSERTVYLRDDTNRTFEPLVTSADTSGGLIEEASFEGVSLTGWQMHVVTATPDLKHVVLSSPLAWTPEAKAEETVQHHNTEINEPGRNLYEWSEGMLQQIDILPESEGGQPASYLKIQPQLAGSSTGEGTTKTGAPRAISNDGTRVAWAWGEPVYPNEFKGLYIRDTAEGRTVRIGGADPLFQTMNASGSKVFYLESGELYVFNYETETTIDLTAGHGSQEASAGVQQAVSDVSEDGSYVYFVAQGVLANGGVSGEDNLYLLHESEGHWSTSYIATLAPQDEKSWFAGGTPDDMVRLSGVSSRVSPNGVYLAFMSERPLTGYDNVDQVNGQRDEEVYLYDADTQHLVCASCNPSGERPVAVSAEGRVLADISGSWSTERTSLPIKPDQWLAGSLPGWDLASVEAAPYQPRYLSDSGRLFFDSPDGLVALATNGLENVYEFEPSGVGGCSPSVTSGRTVYEQELEGRAVEGCVGLISAGTSSAESVFFDASENGDDVFFVTTSKLVGEDYDTGYDVYDAHVCSSSVPCVAQPVSPPACSSGDSCKAAPSPQPEIFGPTPSATFSGVGNVIEEAKPANTVKKKTQTKAKHKKASSKKAKGKRKGSGKKKGKGASKRSLVRGARNGGSR